MAQLSVYSREVKSDHSKWKSGKHYYLHLPFNTAITTNLHHSWAARIARGLKTFTESSTQERITVTAPAPAAEVAPYVDDAVPTAVIE